MGRGKLAVLLVGAIVVLGTGATVAPALADPPSHPAPNADTTSTADSIPAADTPADSCHAPIPYIPSTDPDAQFVSPVKDPLPPGTPVVCEEYVRTGAQKTEGAPASAPVDMVQTTAGDFQRQTGHDLSLSINSSRPIWVATVHAPAVSDGLAKQYHYSVYSLVFDGTGLATDECLGCNLVAELH